MEDDDVLKLLTLVDKYALLMLSLNKKMSSGYFNMTLARKEPRVTNIDNIRFTLSPNKLVFSQNEDNNNNNKNKNNNTSNKKVIWDIRSKAIITDSRNNYINGDDNNTLLYMCALPPKSLRNSQSLFVDSLNEICELSNIINEINRIKNKTTN